jgi:hypothetical protein
MQFSQNIHCCCPIGMLLRNTAEQPRAVATSVKIVMNVSGIGLGIAALETEKAPRDGGAEVNGVD